MNSIASNVRAIDPVVARLALRRRAAGLSRQQLALLACLSTGVIVRAEGGSARSYTASEVARLDLLLSAVEHARLAAAKLAGAA